MPPWIQLKSRLARTARTKPSGLLLLSGILRNWFDLRPNDVNGPVVKEIFA
jgi:hypothetical protein